MLTDTVELTEDTDVIDVSNLKLNYDLQRPHLGAFFIWPW